jgi:DNA-binding response OmpR family regulator
MTATILVNDDDELVGELAESILTRAGYTCLLAREARSAVAVMKTGRIDLLITDIIMPDMDGIDLIGEVRANWPDLPVLAMSGGGRVGAFELLKVARILGANGVVQKPIEAETLLPAVEAALRRRPAEDDTRPAPRPNS